jgi:hypothetical protein
VPGGVGLLIISPVGRSKYSSKYFSSISLGMNERTGTDPLTRISLREQFASMPFGTLLTLRIRQ